MNLSGKYFVYDNVCSKIYNLRFLHIDTTPFSTLSGEISYNTEFFKSKKQNIITGVNWPNSPLSFDVEIISPNELDYDDQRKIKQWLFCKPNYKKLYIDDFQDTEMERIGGVVKKQYVNAVFTNPTAIIYANRIFGYKATLTISSPMALQDKIEFSLTDFSSSFELNVDSDINDYIYPDIELKTSGSCTSIKIKNLTDQSIMQMSDNTKLKSKNLYINGNTCSIYDDTSVSYFGLVQGQRFTRLLPHSNVLSIETDGLISCKFIWQNARWFI